MKHLVLGGGGFIGSHLVQRLLQDNDNEVVAADIQWPDYRYDYWRTADNESYRHTVDLRDTRAAVHLFKNHGPFDYVWQLAADMGGVEYFHSVHDWRASMNNQMINASVMKAVADYNEDGRTIFTSTACALATEYQTHQNRLLVQDGQLGNCNSCYILNEHDLLWGTPDQLYGQEKRNSALLWEGAPYDTRVCFLHSVYGPGQEFAGIRTKFAVAVAQKARHARGTNKIALFGDGQQIRTYLYIDNAIDLLVRFGCSDNYHGPVNIGSVQEYDCETVARIAAVAANTGYITIQSVHGPTGVETRGCDMAKYYSYLNELNNPVYLYQGMAKLVHWLDKVD